MPNQPNTSPGTGPKPAPWAQTGPKLTPDPPYKSEPCIDGSFPECSVGFVQPGTGKSAEHIRLGCVLYINVIPMSPKATTPKDNLKGRGLADFIDQTTSSCPRAAESISLSLVVVMLRRRPANHQQANVEH